jgi:hypothetical protein
MEKKKRSVGQPPKRGVRKVALSLRVTPVVKDYLLASGNASEFVEDMVRVRMKRAKK